MNIKVELNKEQIVKLIKEPIVITEDERLFLDIETFYDLKNAVITLVNGRIRKTVKLTVPFEIPKQFLFSGRLLIAVDLYQDGRKVKTWQFLPLNLVEANGTATAFDEFTELEKRVAALEKKTKIYL